jgi:hypothetical protein
MGRSRRLLAALVLCCVVAAVGGAPAAADDAPPSSPATAPAPAPLDPSAVSTAIALTRTRTKLDQLERSLATAVARENTARIALDQIVSTLNAAQANLDRVRARARARAVIAYQRSGTGHESLLAIDDARDLSSAQHYTQAANDVDDTELARLTALVEDLGQKRADAEQNGRQVMEEHAQLDRDRNQLAELRSREQDLLDQWGAVPIMGDAWLTPAQIADWYRSTGAVPRLAPGVAIDDIARLYVIEGNAEHVRGDLAFAQAVIETGSFKVAAGNNYSGIGVCDSCTGGYGFPTPLDGVRAQIQLLRNYADPDSRAANLANPPSPSLYGTDVAKAATTYDGFFLKGKAPLWNVMGNGNWATDPGYAKKVIEMFARMIAYASQHPA